MQSTTPYNRGDVVLVPFPFTNLRASSRRPALIMSSDAYNHATDDVIIVQITSKVNSPLRPGDHTVAGWQQAGLRMPSRARAKVATLQRNLVSRVLGQMPQDDMQAIENNLRSTLQL